MKRKVTLANCSECGELFVKTDLPMCKKCYLNDYKLLSSISHFIEQNPTKTKHMILQESGVSEEKFNKLLTYGKFWSFKNIDIKCRLCGKPTSASRGVLLCYECIKNVSKFSSAFKKVRNHRENEKFKQKQERDFIQANPHIVPVSRKYSFRTKLSDHFEKYRGTVDNELSEELRGNSSINHVKLSNTKERHGFKKFKAS